MPRSYASHQAEMYQPRRSRDSEETASASGSRRPLTSPVLEVGQYFEQVVLLGKEETVEVLHVAERISPVPAHPTSRTQRQWRRQQLCELSADCDGDPAARWPACLACGNRLPRGCRGPSSLKKGPLVSRAQQKKTRYFFYENLSFTGR